jgi:hypothetical protein
MDWNEIQNFSSNIVFGILLFAMITYWTNLSLFSDSDYISKNWSRIVLIIANWNFIFYSLFSLDCSWIFSIK